MNKKKKKEGIMSGHDITERFIEAWQKNIKQTFFSQKNKINKVDYKIYLKTYF